MSSCHHASDRRSCQKQLIFPVRFAAAKLAEGDQLIMDSLNLDQNEKEMLEHIIKADGDMNVVWTEQQPLHICGLILLKKSVMKQW